jgi:hypothetical protein
MYTNLNEILIPIGIEHVRPKEISGADKGTSPPRHTEAINDS